MSRKPTHIIYAVFKTEGRDDRWQALGALWPHADGNGYSLNLPTVPRDPSVELVIRKASPRPPCTLQRPPPIWMTSAPRSPSGGWPPRLPFLSTSPICPKGTGTS